MGVQRSQPLAAQQWQALIEEQGRSGLSQRVFCAGRGLSLTTFQSWKRRLRRAPSAPALESEFTPLGSIALSPDGEGAESGWDVELDLGGGVCLRLRRR